MSASPPPPQSPNSTAHAYASNGLEILQAATDAAEAAQSQKDPDSAQGFGLNLAHDGQAGDADPAHSLLTHVGPAAAAAQDGNLTDRRLYSNASMVPEFLMSKDLGDQFVDDDQGDNKKRPNQKKLLKLGLITREAMAQNPKLTRLRRACDMCSMRKIRCDDSNHPCKPCIELAVDCTFTRTTKRRGPPNKHAEAAKAAKRARLTGDERMPDLPQSQEPFDPAPSQASPASAIDAEYIAPMPVLHMLIDDFFTYIHPMSPFPHEPTFRQALTNRHDQVKPDFLGLLASMICALVASFPRSVSEHLRSIWKDQAAGQIPRSVTMVERCREIALMTRGNKWALKHPKTLNDAATSYYLGVASGYICQWNASRLFLSETFALIRELGFTRPAQEGELPTFGKSDNLGQTEFNNIHDQVGKRIFWCLLLAVRSFQQLAPSEADLAIGPPTPSFPYPAHPENVEDICVLETEIVDQGDNGVTLLTGFRLALDIYTSMNGVSSLELAYGMTSLPWANQRNLLRDGLVAAKGIIDRLPAELSSLIQDGTPSFDEVEAEYVPPSWPRRHLANDIRNVMKQDFRLRRQLQYEVQRACIFTSLLSTRAYFTEMYFALHVLHLSSDLDSKLDYDADDAEVLSSMTSERDSLVQDLLSLVATLSQRNLEPVSGTVLPRLRHIATSLLMDPQERKGETALKLEGPLGELADVLQPLENHGVGLDADDEKDKVKYWDQLRDWQLRYNANEAFEATLLPALQK